jgi:hypothetical protein
LDPVVQGPAKKPEDTTRVVAELFERQPEGA